MNTIISFIEEENDQRIKSVLVKQRSLSFATSVCTHISFLLFFFFRSDTPGLWVHGRLTGVSTGEEDRVQTNSKEFETLELDVPKTEVSTSSFGRGSSSTKGLGRVRVKRDKLRCVD